MNPKCTRSLCQTLNDKFLNLLDDVENYKILIYKYSLFNKKMLENNTNISNYEEEVIKKNIELLNCIKDELITCKSNYKSIIEKFNIINNLYDKYIKDTYKTTINCCCDKKI